MTFLEYKAWFHKLVMHATVILPSMSRFGILLVVGLSLQMYTPSLVATGMFFC